MHDSEGVFELLKVDDQQLVGILTQSAFEETEKPESQPRAD